MSRARSVRAAAGAAVAVVCAATALLPGCGLAAPAGGAPPPASAASGSSASLRATYWRLTALDGRTLALPAGRLAPYLTLSGEGPQVTGHNGCNRYSGSATVSGSSLTFGPLVSTRMACMDTAALEAAFNAALEATRSHRIRGATLELIDSQGVVRAQFSSDVLR